MKYFYFSWLLVVTQALFAQGSFPSTSSFQVTGEVEKSVTFGYADLNKLKIHNIGTITITNHLGEKKSDVKGLKGVLLKDVLQDVKISSPGPKQLSEYFFTCKSVDGYTVVYSWNELFNNPAGEKIFLVTEKEGKQIEALPESILMVSPADYKTGRRYLKSLQSISVGKAH